MPVERSMFTSYGSVLATGVDDAPSLSELHQLLQRPAWQADAACREHPEVNFFPSVGAHADAAKAVCAGCLVREECLSAALEHGEQAGVWGGLAPRERRPSRRSVA